jgi:diguanylate cyclase (GGDEF)-like protein
MITMLFSSSSIDISKEHIYFENFKVGYYQESDTFYNANEALNLEYKPSPNKRVFGIVKGNIWIKFTITNNSLNTKDYYLNYRDAYLNDAIDFYRYDSDKLVSKKRFSVQDISSTEQFQGSSAIVKYTLKSNAQDTFLIKLEANGRHAFMDLEIQDINSLINDKSSRYLYQLLLFGGLLSLVLYNLILYSNSLKREYLYYSMFVSSYMLFALANNGLAAQFFSIYGNKLSYLQAVPLQAVGIFYILFIHSVFTTSKSYIKMKKHFYIILSIFSVSFLYALFEPRQSILLTQYFVFYLFGVVLVFTYKLYKEKHQLSNYFTGASVFYISANTFIATFYLGFVPYNDFIFNVGLLGVYLEAIIFAFMLSFKIKHLKNENEKKDITIKEVERVAITDDLTGIYNRRHFNNMIHKIIHSPRRKNGIISFLMMDIDHFKQYNDTYGHQMGDDVLKEIGRCLTQLLMRHNDYPFRLGGEEFGIIFHSTTVNNAKGFAEKVRASIEDLKIEHTKNSVSKYVTASIGLVSLEYDKIIDEDTLYKKVDDLLYLAKKNGRNTVMSKSLVDI